MRIKLMIILLFLTAMGLMSQESIKDWSCYKPIEMTGTHKYKYFFLTPDIYRYSQENLSDLRIIDNSNQFIPYYMIEGFKEEKKEDIRYETKLINHAIEKNEDKTVINSIFDFQVLNAKEDYAVNKIDLVIPYQEEYSNQIEILARDEKSDWVLISKDTIYQIHPYKKNQIDFDAYLSYKFFRFIIINNKNSLEIRNCLPLLNTINKKYQSYKDKAELTYDSIIDNDLSVLTIHNPDKLKLLNLSIFATGNFKRDYGLFKSNEQYLASGNIYHFEFNHINISNIKIDLSNKAVRDEKVILKIHNNNDRPLKIDKIEAEFIIDKIIFETGENTGYKVYFGNKMADLPKYDIKNFINYIEKEEKDACSLGKLEVLKATTKTNNENKLYKLLINITIVLISLILIGLLVITLKRK